MRSSIYALTVILLLTPIACEETAPHDTPKPESEQELTITFGGFIANGPQDELLDGQCGTNLARDLLQCDIHNGFMQWNITEITFQVVRTGDRDDERHYYRERISIPSLQTETVAIKLGMQLPQDTRLIIGGRPVGKPQSHWSWLIVGAKGTRATSAQRRADFSHGQS